MAAGFWAFCSRAPRLGVARHGNAPEKLKPWLGGSEGWLA